MRTPGGLISIMGFTWWEAEIKIPGTADGKFLDSRRMKNRVKFSRVKFYVGNVLSIRFDSIGENVLLLRRTWIQSCESFAFNFGTVHLWISYCLKTYQVRWKWNLKNHRFAFLLQNIFGISCTCNFYLILWSKLQICCTFFHKPRLYTSNFLWKRKRFCLRFAHELKLNGQT